MATITSDAIASVEKKYGELRVLDDIIQHRANDKEQKHLIAYPRGLSHTDYEYITAADVNRYIDAVVKRFISLGLGPVSFCSLPILVIKWGL